MRWKTGARFLAREMELYHHWPNENVIGIHPTAEHPHPQGDEV
jgi:hypothetical protein